MFRIIYALNDINIKHFYFLFPYSPSVAGATAVALHLGFAA